MLSDPIKGFGPRLGQIAFGALFREPRQVIELDRDGDKIDIGGITVTVDHTPGHTRGSVVFRVAGWDPHARTSQRVVFTGDTLFRQSVGRTDLPGGSGRDLLGSIVRKTVGARRRHRGTTGARRKVHHRRSNAAPTRSSKDLTSCD